MVILYDMSPSYPPQYLLILPSFTSLFNRLHWHMIMLPNIEIRGFENKRELCVCSYCGLSGNIIRCLCQKISIAAFVVSSTRPPPRLTHPPHLTRPSPTQKVELNLNFEQPYSSYLHVLYLSLYCTDTDWLTEADSLTAIIILNKKTSNC